MRIKPVTILLLALVVQYAAWSAAGQRLERADAHRALESACDGAWLRVEATVSSLSHMPKDSLDRAERARVACLLQAIAQTTFDDDPQTNDVHTHAVVSTVVSVYGPEGYDFFASEFANQSARVQRALDAALFGRGHPDAFRRYFEKRRADGTRHDSSKKSIAATPAVWSSVIERGTCGKELCSERIEETLQIVRRNLDIVDADLALAESVAASSSSSEATDAAQKTRSSARHLREVIGRIRRGDVPLGASIQ